MPQTLTEVLQELIRNMFGGGTVDLQDKYNKQCIAQAKSKIEEMFGEWVGSDIPMLPLTTDYRLGAKTQDYIKGCNQAKQEIRNRVKESK